MGVVLAWAGCRYVGGYGEFVISESVGVSFDETTAMPFVFQIFLVLVLLLLVHWRKRWLVSVEIFQQLF